MLSGAIAYQVLQQENPVTIDRATEVCRFVLGTALHFSALSGLAYATRNGRCPPAPAWPLCFPRDRQEAEMELTQPHTVAQSFEVFAKQYPSDLVYPIFGLLKRTSVGFPVRESEEAINAFVWVVGKQQTETVAEERAAIATRNRSPERLQTPVLRALRQTRDYYFEDVRKNPNDNVAQRIPRWGKEVQTLPVYKGKIDIPHPVALAWEYESLKEVCELIKKEEGFSGWTRFAQRIGDGQSDHIPFLLWSKDDPPIEVDVPEDATPSEAAF